MIPNASPQELPRLAITTTTSRAYPSKSAAARWQAVVTRDPTATFFVYAVLTTRIYCRPSCPGRLARRANVQFYDTPTQAEQAGFRACKRCRPQAQPGLANPQIQLIQRACATIEASLVGAGSRPTLRTLAAEAKLTPSHFHRVFKKVVGVTPGQYADAVVEGVVAVGGMGSQGVSTGGLQLQACGSGDGDGENRLGGEGEGGEIGDLGGVVAPWNEFDEALIAAGVDLAAATASASASANAIATGAGVRTGDGSVSLVTPVLPAVEFPGSTEMLEWDLFVGESP